MIPNIAPAPADTAPATAAAAIRPTAGQRTALSKVSASRLFASPGGVAGLGWLAALVVASLTAEWWFPYKTEDQDFTAVLSGPTAAH